MSATSDDGRLAPHLERRRRAALAGHTGDAATARALLDDPDPGVRATALGALDRIGALSAHELAAALADPEVGVRRRACEVAALWPSPAAAADPGAGAGPGAGPGAGARGDSGTVALLALLDDPDPVVVEVAAWACGERLPPEPGVVDRLARLATDHDDALCREAAVAALGALGDEAGLPAILAATADKATVRRRAVIALAPFEGPGVAAALDAARTDRDWQVRQAAEDLLADD